MKATPQFVCIVKTHEVIGLMLFQDGDGWTIRGFDSLGDGLRFFEAAYNANHFRGYEASMSALINGITFQPSIVKLTLAEIEPLVQDRVRTTVRNASGVVHLLPLVPEAATLWETGSRPKLAA